MIMTKHHYDYDKLYYDYDQTALGLLHVLRQTLLWLWLNIVITMINVIMIMTNCYCYDKLYSDYD